MSPVKARDAGMRRTLTPWLGHRGLEIGARSRPAWFVHLDDSMVNGSQYGAHELRMRRSHSKSRLVTTSSMRRSLRSRFSNLRLTLCSAPTLELE